MSSGCGGSCHTTRFYWTLEYLSPTRLDDGDGHKSMLLCFSYVSSMTYYDLNLNNSTRLKWLTKTISIGRDVGGFLWGGYNPPLDIIHPTVDSLLAMGE